jgi:hypothetical protein
VAAFSTATEVIPVRNNVVINVIILMIKILINFYRDEGEEKIP